MIYDHDDKVSRPTTADSSQPIDSLDNPQFPYQPRRVKIAKVFDNWGNLLQKTVQLSSMNEIEPQPHTTKYQPKPALGLPNNQIHNFLHELSLHKRPRQISTSVEDPSGNKSQATSTTNIHNELARAKAQAERRQLSATIPMFEPPTKVTPRDERHKVLPNLPESNPINPTSNSLKSIMAKPLLKLVKEIEKPKGRKDKAKKVTFKEPAVQSPSQSLTTNKKDKHSRRHKHKRRRSKEAIEHETVVESDNERIEHFLQSSATSLAEFDKNGPQDMDTGPLSPNFPLEPMEITPD